MKLLFDDATFSFELVRVLSYAPFGGADVNEVLSAAQRIKSGDFESWYNEWHRLADHVAARADAFSKAGQPLSASNTYFKASNYYRAAEFFLHGDPSDVRINDASRLSRMTFQQALKLSAITYEKLAIPYEDTTMPAYFYSIDEQPRPTLIVHGGYDSTGEELFFQVAQSALAHGYNCLTFEGPGQGAMIREEHLAFRPDWEKVVSPAIDVLIDRPNVEADKISLMGISFGGLLAPRAAAFDHRLAAVICDDGVFSFQFGQAFAAHGGTSADFSQVEAKLTELMQQSTNVRWVVENGLFTFGAKSIKELFEKTDAYTLAGVADKITCPVLVCEASNDQFFKGQPEMLYNALTTPHKTLMKFDAADGTEEHCHLGGLTYFNERVFNWLDETLIK
ncbi:alpha/beta hydrolase family protein [Furfurilactobacillus siliginis]|uniref:Hypothetical dipeptidyl aminopeptidase/ acylaminoacyl-peptidase related protein n=1 Tax=Furfurilactobacillus siliginis TaxID=348151 RepID=A0A0R2LB28_9LACO|nr:alpha/beta fold hydrolase [Furfurilactobacillus siliginis]KRN96981.1 hypothetical protein IV55_GL000857 [Furfurilactobacillus siliginis]GEK27740.1 hypothetical dipeptidyl aminopeptidase/ acylaminoacyl-peptidase related protein [Furfurilactobacillus siliginis]